MYLYKVCLSIFKLYSPGSKEVGRQNAWRFRWSDDAYLFKWLDDLTSRGKGHVETRSQHAWLIRICTATAEFASWNSRPHVETTPETLTQIQLDLARPRWCELFKLMGYGSSIWIRFWASKHIFTYYIYIYIHIYMYLCLLCTHIYIYTYIYVFMFVMYIYIFL